MNLREDQAKAIFAARGIRVPRGEVVVSPGEAERAAGALGGAVVLKPLLQVKGRGKVGGIGFADTPAEAVEEAVRLLGTEIRGEQVRRLLVEERIRIERELYLAVTIDAAARRPLLMAGVAGGVEIETIARERPEALIRIHGSVLEPPEAVDLAPVRDGLGAEAARALGILYRVFRDHDAEMVETNPIVVTADGLVAVDAVLNVNDAALSRHPDLRVLQEADPDEDPLVAEARRNGWTWLDLGGEIGIVSSGAGLTMAIVDLIARGGGRAANFLDTAQVDRDGIYRAFEMLQRARPPRVWLVNVFAGLNRCDELAEGIRDFLRDHRPVQPVVVRMAGNGEEEGHRLLREAGIDPVVELEEAVEHCLRLAGEASR